MMRDLQEWIKFFEKKASCKYTPLPGSQLEFDELQGFCNWKQDNDIMYIGVTCGNGMYWNNFIQLKAKELGCKTLRFGTYRNPATFIRKFGYKVVGYILEKDVN